MLYHTVRIKKVNRVFFIGMMNTSTGQGHTKKEPQCFSGTGSRGGLFRIMAGHMFHHFNLVCLTHNK
jgi:hypothetical protein